MIEHERTYCMPDGGAPAERGALRTAPALLTPRQREIAQLIAGGYTNAEIGVELSLDRTAVAEEVERLRDGLALDARLQIAAWALECAPAGDARDGGTCLGGEREVAS